MSLTPLPVCRKAAPTSEAASFEQIFRDHYPDLCRYAFAITKAHDVAEEVVSDVFLKFWMLRDNMTIRTTVIAYLVTATRNQAIDRLRKSARQHRRWCALQADYKADYALPHEILIGAETNRIIEAAVEALPPQGKLIFSMSRDRRMSYQEIARTLVLSVKTVEAHMGRSLKTLRTSLRKQEVLN